MFTPPCYQPAIMQHVSKLVTKLPYKKLQYATYVKDIDLDAHIKVFNKAIKANGEIVKVDIINMFSFTLKDSISKWGGNYVQDHPRCTFEELEQTFCKRFKVVKNNEKVYMQLQNIQQQTVELVEVYYECMLKLTNCLQVKIIDVSFTTILKVGLLPYLILTTRGMKRDTSIKHKETIVACEESGPISLNYNVLLNTPRII